MGLGVAHAQPSSTYPKNESRPQLPMMNLIEVDLLKETPSISEPLEVVLPGGEVVRKTTKANSKFPEKIQPPSASKIIRCGIILLESCGDLSRVGQS